MPLIALGLIVIGAFGPWADGESGVEGDGVITLCLVLGVGVFRLAFRPRPGPRAVGLAICAIAALAVSIRAIAGTDRGDVGWGLWLSLAGSAVLSLAALIGLAVIFVVSRFRR